MCLEKLGKDNCTDVFNNFYNIKSKNEQDIYLQTLIDGIQVTEKDRKLGKFVKKSQSFDYKVIVGTIRTSVCMKAFLGIFAISEKRMRRLRLLKQVGQTPEDKRGRHMQCNALSIEVHNANDHIRSFPLHESHNTGQKVFYLNPELSIRTMWKLF